MCSSGSWEKLCSSLVNWTLGAVVSSWRLNLGSSHVLLTSRVLLGAWAEGLARCLFMQVLYCLVYLVCPSPQGQAGADKNTIPEPSSPRGPPNNLQEPLPDNPQGQIVAEYLQRQRQAAANKARVQAQWRTPAAPKHMGMPLQLTIVP